MPQPPILKVSEIFFSAAGEGGRQGEPTIFIRLAGCNLRCSFCDTKYAWKVGREMTIEEISARADKIKKKFRVDWVCLTGGEPLLQELKPLALKLRRAGFKIQVETNGTRPLNIKPDWLTVSPKPPDYRLTADCRRLADEVKLVVTRRLGLREIRRVRQALSGSVTLFLQPQSAASWSYKKAWQLYLQAARAGLCGVRLSCQLHKIYRIK
ncbi:MAG: 7-carboxy-7-deazaguanine synthase QueE [Candidatus Saccharicenans sp.]|nr:7-carboxy-7-deazaguanine synthase QueE [Candidatus Saccharicenans sp.]